jgi:hypothetical protein
MSFKDLEFYTSIRYTKVKSKHQFEPTPTLSQMSKMYTKVCIIIVYFYEYFILWVLEYIDCKLGNTKFTRLGFVSKIIFRILKFT